MTRTPHSPVSPIFTYDMYKRLVIIASEQSLQLDDRHNRIRANPTELFVVRLGNMQDLVSFVVDVSAVVENNICMNYIIVLLVIRIAFCR